MFVWVLVWTVGFGANAGPVPADDVPALMAKAETLWEQRADLTKLQESMRIHETISSQDPTHVEAMWKLARGCWWLGTHSPEDQKLAIFERGMEYAKKAVAFKDDCAACHYWLGVNFGVYGESKGVLKSLSLVDPIKEEMNKVIKLDPGFMHGGAYRLLGRMAYKLPWFAGGSKKESVEHLKKALEYGPNSFLTRVFLAETYLAMDEKELAKGELAWCVNAPEPQDPGEREDRNKAKKLHQEHFK
jgi:tetratricopeptide (TPR) repeat protein